MFIDSQIRSSQLYVLFIRHQWIYIACCSICLASVKSFSVNLLQRHSHVLCRFFLNGRGEENVKQGVDHEERGIGSLWQCILTTDDQKTLLSGLKNHLSVTLISKGTIEGEWKHFFERSRVLSTLFVSLVGAQTLMSKYTLKM